MMRARAQTMTSVIDAVTEQSIIGTDQDGLIRVWNPGAERMLGLPRADVVRLRSITDVPRPRGAVPADAPTADAADPLRRAGARGAGSTAATSGTGPT